MQHLLRRYLRAARPPHVHRKTGAAWHPAPRLPYASFRFPIPVPVNIAAHGGVATVDVGYFDNLGWPPQYQNGVADNAFGWTNADVL
jgi:hypothetical protein